MKQQKNRKIKDYTYNTNIPDDFFRIKKPIYIDYGDQETVRERYLGDNRVDGLLYSSLSKDSYALKTDSDVFARFYDSKQAGKYGVSNNGVRIELGLKYLDDAKKVTSELVARILENASKKYEISEEEMKLLSRYGATEQQEAMIAHIDNKYNKGEQGLKEAFESVIELYERYDRAVGYAKSQGTGVIESKLNNFVSEKCFSSPIGGKDWGSVDGETKRQLLESAVKESQEEFKAKLLEIGCNPMLMLDEDMSSFIKNAKIAQEAHKAISQSFKISSVVRNNIPLNTDFIKTMDAIKAIQKYKEDTQNGEISYHSKKRVEDILTSLNQSQEYDEKKGGWGNSVFLSGLSQKSGLEKKKEINELVADFQKGDKKATDKLMSVVFESLKQMSNTRLNSAFDTIVDDKLRQTLKEDYTRTIESVSDSFNSANSSNMASIDALTDKLDSLAGDKMIFNILEHHKDNEIISGLLNDRSWKGEMLSNEDANFDALLTDGAEVMNLYNMSTNENIRKKIQEDSVDDVVSETMKSTALAGTAKSVLKERDRVSDQIKEDLSLDQKIARTAEQRYVKKAGEVLKEASSNILMNRDALKSFRSCLSSAGIKKRGMDTVFANTSACLEKFQEKIEQEAQKTVDVLNASLNGVGAINPFALLQMGVAKYRTGFPKELRDDLERLSNSMMDMTKKITTAGKEVDRSARYSLEENASANGVSASVIHNSQRKSFVDAILKEGAVNEIVEFNKKNKDSVSTDPNQLSSLIDKYKSLGLYSSLYANKAELDKDKLNAMINAMNGSIDINNDASSGADVSIDSRDEVGVFAEKANATDVPDLPLDGELPQESIGQSSNSENGFKSSRDVDGKSGQQVDEAVVSSGNRIRDIQVSLMTINQLKRELATSDTFLLDAIKVKRKALSITDNINEVEQRNLSDEELEDVLKNYDKDNSAIYKILKNKPKPITFDDIEKEISSLKNDVERDRIVLMQNLILENIKYIKENMNNEVFQQFFPNKKIDTIRDSIVQAFDAKSGLSDLERLNILSQGLDMIGNADATTRESMKIFRESADISVNSKIGKNDVASIIIASGVKGTELDLFQDVNDFLSAEKNEKKQIFSYLKLEDNQDFDRVEEELQKVGYAVDKNLLEGTIQKDEENSLKNFSDYQKSIEDTIDSSRGVSSATETIHSEATQRLVLDNFKDTSRDVEPKGVNF